MLCTNQNKVCTLCIYSVQDEKHPFWAVPGPNLATKGQNMATEGQFLPRKITKKM